MFKKLKVAGPGALVAAAFIGPGTVTACTLAGANFGYALLWSLLFATLATIILQEMSVRLGVVTQRGLGETLRLTLEGSIWKMPLFALIGVALYLGNAAYEAGNLSGAALGIEAILGEDKGVFKLSVAAISLIAAALLAGGSYKYIEKTLIALVMVMAAAFVATFAIVRPDLSQLARGLFIPSTPDNSLFTIIALIGTTVVPYNLFLHASAAKAKWAGEDSLTAARADTGIAIGLGGLITVLIVSTAASSMFATGAIVSSAGDMARQFEPLFGPASTYLLGIGLFAAGLSSSITAPLATAFAMTEVLGLNREQRSTAFRLIALSVILIGAGFSLTGVKPINIILSAQFANGFLLPIIAIFLLFVMNKNSFLGQYTNDWKSNLLGFAIIIVTIGLGLRLIIRVITAL